MPAALSSRVKPLVSDSDGGRCAAIARVEAFASLVEAAPVWERLASGDAVVTPFADPAWIAAWQRHVGAHGGLSPLIVVARDGFDAPLALIPFAVRRGRFCTTAHCFGGSHSHLNMGVWRRDVARTMTAEQLSALLAEVAAKNGIDLFVLRNQPLAWDGCDNPLARLGHQPSPDSVYRLEFNHRTGEQVIKHRLKPNLRGLLKYKERKLQRLDGYRYFRATTAADVDRVLDAFFLQKATQFASRGIRDVFSAPGMNAFLREACKNGLAEGHPAIELHAIEGGGEVLAVLGGVAGRRRFASMFNSYTTGEHGKWSPGLIVITHVIKACADRGLSSFDLGIGYADYKWYFCKEIDSLFDSVLAYSPAGRLAALAWRSAFAARRWIKSTPPLRNALLMALRAWR